jgi:hypothetical protein
VTALAPAAGSAGQALTLSGSGFFSAGGHILVTFGGAEAPTACPTRTTCTVTVPSLGPAPGSTGPTAPRVVPVVVTTDTGTSNQLTFTYM